MIFRFLLAALGALLILGSFTASPSAQAQTFLDWVPVDGAANAPDDTGFGAVAVKFDISKS